MEKLNDLIDTQASMIINTYNNIQNLQYLTKRINGDANFLIPFTNNLSYMLYGEITKNIHGLLKDRHSKFKLTDTVNYIRKNKNNIYFKNEFENEEIDVLIEKLKEIGKLSEYKIIKRYRDQIFAHNTTTGNLILENMYNSKENHLQNHIIILDKFQEIINQINYWLYGKPRITHEIISSNFEDFMKIYERR